MEAVAEKYKKTEVGFTPSDWEVKTLGEVGDVKMCRRILNNETSPNGTIPFYKIGTFGKEPDAYISKEQYDEYRKRFSFPRKGDILISAAGTIGRTIIYNGEDAYFQDSNIVWIENNFNNVSNEFLYHIYQVANYNTEGGTIQRLYNSILKATKFACPELTEQTLIATALSDADALISSLEKLIAKKRNIKQGAMQKLLQPKEGWEVKKLGEVCDVRDGTHDSPKYFDSGVMFVTSKNIIDGKLDFTEISFISTEDAHQVNQRSKVDKGDILMSMIGTIGNAVLVNFEPNFCIKNVALLKPKKIITTYLLQLIYSQSFQKYIESKLDGGIQKFISLGVLRDLDIPFPALEEQTRIATILSDMDTEITALETKLDKYKKVKLGMMQNLLTGKIRLV